VRAAAGVEQLYHGARISPGVRGTLNVTHEADYYLLTLGLVSIGVKMVTGKMVTGPMRCRANL